MCTAFAEFHDTQQSVLLIDLDAILDYHPGGDLFNYRLRALVYALATCQLSQ